MDLFGQVYDDSVAWSPVLTLAGHTGAALGKYRKTFILPRSKMLAVFPGVERALVNHLMPHLEDMEAFGINNRKERGDVLDVSMALRHMGKCLLQSVLDLGDR
jgi:hypothetical protein